MSVNITWEIDSVEGTLVTHSPTSNGSSSTQKVITVKHDGNNQITSCRLWLTAVSSGYSGSASPATDLTEFIGWADQNSLNGFGGLQVNMDAAGSFPVDKWPSWTQKFGDDFSSFYTGRGNLAENGVLLHPNMNSNPPMPANGTIPADCTTWPTFQTRIHVPQDENNAGTRQVEQRLRFTYTS
jgi:hypothetical protein